MWAFSLIVSGGYSLVAVCRLLSSVTSLVAAHRLEGTCCGCSVVAACGLSSWSSQALEHRFSSRGIWA